MSLNKDIFVAIDMGSNSFHMLMVQNINGTPRTISKVKRKVRLASGLDQDNMLDEAAMERGWQCLSLFAERLEHIPKRNIRVVSTATLRLAKNAEKFCAKGNEILGLPINIISGEREAALIYHGMAVSSHSADKRMIVDIGGASTELILGQNLKPLVLNSLNMGCVTWLERHFSDGLISTDNIERAKSAARGVLAPVKQDYLAHQWQLSLGASGSIQAVQEVLVAQGLNEQITQSKLEIILEQSIACTYLTTLNIKGLKEERKVVFVSGLVILLSLFEELAIDCMIGSGGALREGLIDELIREPVADDIRFNCVNKLQQRYHVDLNQASQVAKVAETLAHQLRHHKISAQDIAMLRYAAMLHEVGASVEFLNAPKHGHYLLSHAAMAGFSKQQRMLVASLVGNFRNELNMELLAQQAWCSVSVASLLVSCLRLAVILCGRYQGERIQYVSLSSIGDEIEINISASTLTKYPLLLAELEQEIIDNEFLSLREEV